MRKFSFDFDEFKKWMDGQENPSDHMDKPQKRDLIGTKVEAKVNNRKFAEKMEPESGVLAELSLDFRKNGGEIIGVEDNRFLIEVDSGSFYVLKHHVKKFSS